MSPRFRFVSFVSGSAKTTRGHEQIASGTPAGDSKRIVAWLYSGGAVPFRVVLAAVVFATDGPMDFIERYLGFSPDGGDGSMEILVAMMLVVIVVVIGLRLATSKTAT